MNCTPALAAIAALGLVACETMNAPITSGDFDPLRPPGSNVSSTVSATPAFSAGQFVRATMDSTAFFKSRPNGDADADKLLKRGTSMKVVSTTGSYVKVELDSGEIGFVPTVMVEDPNAVPQMATNPGEFQVYPPLTTGIGEPLPIIDPAGLPPDGAIPTVIDPDAPAIQMPVPPATTLSPDQFATPVPPVESKPLPPNGEELEAMKKAQEEAAKPKE